MFSRPSRDGESKSFPPSCCYQSPKHQVIEAADIKYIRYSFKYIFQKWNETEKPKKVKYSRADPCLNL